MSIIKDIENDFKKLEAWFKKEALTAEQKIDKAAVFITAQLDPEIEQLIANGTLIAIEKVIDVITKSNIGDVMGAAVVKEWPKIVQVALDVQKVVANWPVIKTMLAAQIKGILNSELHNPGEPKIQKWIKDVELIFEDLKQDIQSIG